MTPTCSRMISIVCEGSQFPIVRELSPLFVNDLKLNGRNFFANDLNCSWMLSNCSGMDSISSRKISICSRMILIVFVKISVVRELFQLVREWFQVVREWSQISLRMISLSVNDFREWSRFVREWLALFVNDLNLFPNALDGSWMISNIIRNVAPNRCTSAFLAGTCDLAPRSQVNREVSLR